MQKEANPKVSIIIPAYNASKYLKEAIGSALAQTYENLEIIVVNDGSNDKGKTEKIAQSYGTQIKYYYKENGGVSTALNLGISKMAGEYFSWLSHDDKYYPDKIEKQIRYLKENNLLYKKVILYSDYDLMDNHSRIFATSIKNHEELQEKPEYCLLRGAINGLSLLIPKEAFEECGVFDEKLRCVQDYELWDRMQKHYKFVHQQEILVTTRLHKTQQGNTSPKMLSEGNEFWTNLIKGISKQRREELEKTEYNFLSEMYEFLKNTPYNLTSQYVKKQMDNIEKKAIKEIQNIKVSVIIPFYNRIDLLKNSINSVLQQTHKNIEILLIDDGTTESIKAIEILIKENPTIRYIKNDTNKGASYSRNIGIKEATGKYIAFLDSDDCFKREKIQQQLKEMYLKGYEFSHTSYIRKDSNIEQTIQIGRLTGEVIPKIIGGCGIATPTVMIKTEFLRENKLQYDETMEIGEDVCFYLEALRKTKLLGINKPLTVVNTNNNSAAYNIEKQLKGLKTIIRYVLNDNELSKYNYEIGLLLREFIRICDMRNKNLILFESEELSKIKQSTSWKITKPLRTLKNVRNLYKTEGIIFATKRIIKNVLKKLKIMK